MSSRGTAARAEPVTEPTGRERVAGAVAYAGFWIRAVAAMIDTVLYGIVQGTLFFTVFAGGTFEWSATVVGPLAVLLSQIVPAIIAMVFWVNWSATPGKMVVGARIVDAYTGGRPSPRRFLERYFAYYISSLPLGLGFLWVVWDRHKQGWHDKLAGTVVVRRASSGGEAVRFEAPV